MPFFTQEQKKIIEMIYPARAEEFNELLESFGDFVEKRILPTAPNIDRLGSFPKENLDNIFKQGFTNIPYPEDLGGLNLPFVIYVACMELVAKACASTAISLAIHGTVCDGIYSFGNREQHEKYLKPLISGEKLGAFALTEEGGGSDARAMKTLAQIEGENWRINGAKMFITNSGKADYYLVFAKTNKGFASIVVPSHVQGFSHGANIPKLGLKGSTLMGLNLDQVIVPYGNLLGEDGEGFEYAKKMLFSGRITVAAISIGIAQMALEKTVKYAKERKAFGKTLSRFQLTRGRIAELQTEISAARLLTYQAAFLKNSQEANFHSEACQAKLFATEMALRVCNEAIQIHGGLGYTDEADVHRHWRDAKLMTIGEGTSEIMKIIISGILFGEGESTL